MSRIENSVENKILARKAFHVWLWLAQILLALVFGIGGYLKLTLPPEDLAANLGWPADLPLIVTRLVGALEFLGAVGLVVPQLFRKTAQVTPWAAGGLALIMVSALLFHFARNEVTSLPVNVLLGATAMFVAWGRWHNPAADTEKIVA